MLLEPYGQESEDYMEKFVEFSREEAIANARENAPTQDPKNYTLDWTDEQCYEWTKEWWGYEEDEDNGDLYYLSNPNTEWDWWTVGGRWKNSLKHKYTGQYEDSVKIANIDWEGMKKDKIVEMDFDEWHSHYKEEYKQQILEANGGSIEQWKENNSNFHTFALLLPDEGWVAVGDMGWFGCSSETPDERVQWNENYRKMINKYQDYYLTIVDCHI